MATSELQRVDSLAEALAERGIAGPDRPVDLAVVLGSGLKTFARRLGPADGASAAVEVPVGELPEWPVPHVEGHGGSIVRGTVGGLRVACLTGRVHLYEGWDPAAVVRPLRALLRAGCGTVLLTNASGGIRRDLRAGTLMVVADHVNLTGRSALVGPHEPAFGPRFPDQTAVWDPELRERLRDAAGGAVQEGVYGGVLGPTYETPAEIRMLAAVGADAVGMSTVLEASAAHAMGARVAGLSLISNAAAGLGGGAKLSHDEVVAAGDAAAQRMGDVVEAFCRGLAS